MHIPAPVLKAAHKAGNWIVKNGPTIMSVSGGLMAVGGAVMACNATLKVDEVLDRHKEKMARIEAAKALSDENGDNELSENDIKKAKFETYRDTSIELVKLYAPSFAVGMSGVGLMQAAFVITERRRASAVAALTTLDQMYQNLVNKSNAIAPELRLTEENPQPTLLEDGTDRLILEPENETDPFFFIFDAANANFQHTFKKKDIEFLTNEQFILGTVDTLNYRLSGYQVDHIWLNDVLRALGIEESEFGQHYGWNAMTGDQIVAHIIPFVKDDNGVFVEIDMEHFRELDRQDIQQGYYIGVRFKSLSDGYDEETDPRFIYSEVFGG